MKGHPSLQHEGASLSCALWPDPDRELERQRIMLNGDVPSPMNGAVRVAPQYALTSEGGADLCRRDVTRSCEASPAHLTDCISFPRGRPLSCAKVRLQA